MERLLIIITLSSLTMACEENGNPVKISDTLIGNWKYTGADAEILLNIQSIDYMGYSRMPPLYWYDFYDTIPDPHETYIIDYQAVFKQISEGTSFQMNALNSSRIIRIKKNYHLILGDIANEKAEFVGYLHNVKGASAEMVIKHCGFDPAMNNKRVTFFKQ